MSKRKSKLKKSFSNDGLRDALSGIGGEKDILTTGIMGFANYVTSKPAMLESMYRANIWVKKAVSIPANYAVKGWRLLEDKDIEKAEAKINLKENVALSLKWGELFGGSMVVFIVDDGLTPDKPINYKKLKPDSFKRLIVVDRWKVTNAGAVNKDVLSDDFMQPEAYQVNIEGQLIKFHPSRVHKIVPNKLTSNEEKREQYWGVSQIEIIYRQLIADDVFISNLANMMKKSTLDIFSIPNLSGMILNGQEEQIQKRLRINQMTMSTLNAYVKDAGTNGQNAETYERITQAFTGFDSLDIQSQARIASAAEIPATIFLGKSPDGMNATGYSDLSIFSDRLSSIRELLVDPLLYKIDNILKACFGKNEDVRYEWSNPFPKSAKEEADIRLINIQVIEKMVALDLPNVVIADKFVDYELVDSTHKDEVLKGLEIESFDIEDDPFNLPIPKEDMI